MEISVWSKTDVGRKREHNEDAVLVVPELGLYAVADGMGGHAAGEVASALAIAAVKDRVEKEWSKIEQAGAPGPQHKPSQVLEVLEEAVQAACLAIYSAAQEDRRHHGMGTTLSLLLVNASGGYIAHVGDTRIYLLREGECHQLTIDHSLVNEQVRRGKIARKDAGKVRYRNVITRALGIQSQVRVDTLHLDVLPGDRFLICSDGLHGYLRSGELQSLVREAAAEHVVDLLVDLANERGGKDNISVVYAQVADDEQEAAQELRRRMSMMRKAPLFRYLNYRELVQLMNRTYIKTAQPGEVLIEENLIGEEMFLLVDGQVEVSKGGQQLALLEAGAAFGEMALIDNAPRSATVKALNQVRLVVISRKQFYDTIKGDPTCGVKLLWSFLQILSSRLRSTDELLQKAKESTAIEVDPDWIMSGD